MEKVCPLRFRGKFGEHQDRSRQNGRRRASASVNSSWSCPRVACLLLATQVVLAVFMLNQLIMSNSSLNFGLWTPASDGSIDTSADEPTSHVLSNSAPADVGTQIESGSAKSTVPRRASPAASTAPYLAPRSEPMSSDAEQPGRIFGHFCDSEIPSYDLKEWEAEHGQVLPDHPAVFRGDEDREGMHLFDTQEKFLSYYGDHELMHAAHPEYAQSGGFGANFPARGAKKMTIRQLAQEWAHTHRYYFMFSCPNNTICTTVGKHLGTPKLFEGPVVSTNFLVGGPESGQPIHNHGKTWQGLTSGRKLWVLLPPERVTMDMHDKTGPYLFPLRGWAKMMNPSMPIGERPLLCVQKPGEIIYFPDKWYHGTLNLDEFQLAWGGKPKDRPEQENSPAQQAIMKYFPTKGPRGAEFPYSLSVHLDQFERECSKGEAQAHKARPKVDGHLERMKTESERISRIVHNNALLDNGAFVYCALARKLSKSKTCADEIVRSVATTWWSKAKQMSPAVANLECFQVKTQEGSDVNANGDSKQSAPMPQPAPERASSRRTSAAQEWGNYCDPEVPVYDLNKWRAEHGDVLPDHPAIFKDDKKREGYQRYSNLNKFLDFHGDEIIGAAPEYGQAGGFGANVHNRGTQTMSVRELAKEWATTHRYHSRFDCQEGSFCSKVWKHLGTPGLFEGPAESTNFLIGGPESGLPLHNHQKTWQGLVAGRKMWFLMPHDRVTMELHDATGPYLFPLRGWANTMKGLPLGKRPLACVQKPGEIFYFPDRWFHGTLNLDEFQLAWGGKPKDRPQQTASSAAQAIYDRFPASTMRGADFPYSLSVRMDTFERQCSAEKALAAIAANELDEPLQRQKKAAERLQPIVRNTALADNSAFAFCAVAHKISKSKCPEQVVDGLTRKWHQQAVSISPAVARVECPESAFEACGAPTELATNKQCEQFTFVSGSPGLSSLSECQKKVASECPEPTEFAWRSSNGACHCIPLGCSRIPNVGISIYRLCEDGSSATGSPAPATERRASKGATANSNDSPGNLAAGKSAAEEWGNYCDPEVPVYDLEQWGRDHGKVLPDHPAIFRDDVDRPGYKMFNTLKKFIDAHGDEVVAGNPEYGQAGGFGANVPNHNVKHLSVKKMAEEWNTTHRYHSRFECAPGTFCSKIWKHLGTPKLFEGPSDSLNFLFGGPESGLPLHNHGKTWQGLVSGRKMWILMPHDRVTMELHDATGPYLFPLRGWVSTMHGLPLGKRPLICVQKPGDIFYFPDKWFHGTLNLDEFQLAWGGKPKNRPEQTPASPQAEAIYKHFPRSNMRGADFPYSLAVRLGTFERLCKQDEEQAALQLDEPLQRQKKAATKLAPLVHNNALAENAAFSFCAVAARVQTSRCPRSLVQRLTSQWHREAREASPSVSQIECPRNN